MKNPRRASRKVKASYRRRFPVGAEVCRGGTHFRVWAPDRRKVEVLLEPDAAFTLRREADGYFSGLVKAASAGTRYRLRLDEDPSLTWMARTARRKWWIRGLPGPIAGGEACRGAIE